MGTPLEALPLITVAAIQELVFTLDLFPTKNVEILSTKAEYHIIALIQFEGHQQNDLILRVVGSHVPFTKTENEVTVIKWLQQNTSIPVPTVTRYDSTTKNPLGCEYILQERLPGQSLDEIWPDLSEDERVGVLDFAANCLVQLTEVEWSHVGSLRIEEEKNSSDGPILDERFWEHRDIDKFWTTENGDETVVSLNPLGPYRSFVDYTIGRIKKYMYAIRRHASLEFMREHLPLIENFVEAIRDEAEELNKGARLCLAHRDFHMGNIMYDPSARRVTGVLDWEFSVVMPLQQGDLSRAFLFDMQSNEGWAERKEQMLEIIRRRDKKDVLKQFEYSSGDQEAMQDAVDLLRAIVEVSPRGQREKERDGWMREMVGIMEEWVD